MRGLLFMIALGAGSVPAVEAFGSCPDLALVLAIDGSGSIDDAEFLLQRQGYAAAFTNEKVQEAIAAAGVVDVAVVFWGDEEMAPQIVPFRRIAAAGDKLRLAADVASLPRRVNGNTGIGSGLWTALDLLEGSCAARRIINVSGDGRESFSPRPRNHVPLELARSRATGMGVTINALAILTEGPDLATWYRDRVITGPGAFVMQADDFEAFGVAIRRKLSREIALPVVALADGLVEEQR